MTRLPTRTLAALAALVVALPLAAPSARAQAAGLFFSEYVEGSSFNKAVEIYNPTGSAVDLSGYTLELYSNGSPTITRSVALAGTLAPGAVFVAAHPSADPAVLAVASLTDGSVVNFNGDDAVVLRGPGGVADAIGQVGVDPGSAWGSGATSTQDHTLRRKPAACTGDTDPLDDFEPAVLYDGFERDTFGGLGAHTATCSGDPGNTPPAFTAVLTDRAVAVGQAFEFAYAATDDDGDALAFSLAAGPPGATLDAAGGVFRWTPTAADAGQSYTVAVAVSDGQATVTTQATLTVPGAPSATSDVFVSEYVEGSSNNKAVEVYNATGAPVSLDGYRLELYFNGGTSPSTIALSGTLAPGNVYVVANSGADPDGGDAFDPASQFDGFEQDTFSGLGAHTANCGTGGGPGGGRFSNALQSTLVDAGQTLAFDYDAAGEGQGVVYTLVDSPAGATIDPASGVFAWTTTATGVFPVTVVASGAGIRADTTQAVVGVRGVLFAGQTGAELRASVRATYAPARTLGYGPARDVMYAEIDREADGSVVGVYTGFSVALPDGVDPSAFLAQNGINAEHTWPQSKGAADEPGRSDIHNLFPAKSNVNSARSNKPLVDIPDAQTQTWYRLDQAQPAIPTDDIDAWSESHDSAFEPREVHKGNAARAALYFYTVYEPLADAVFLAVQRDAFLDWVNLDPADGPEVERTYEISLVQGNVNPFLLDVTLAARVVEDLEAAPLPAMVTIAGARALPDGALVTVTGVVTRARGRLTRLQDSTAGIALFQTFGGLQAAVASGAVAAGDSVEVTGTLASFNGLRQITPTGAGASPGFTVVSRGNALPAPQRLTLAELAAAGEAVESELVEVAGLTVETTDEAFQADTSYEVSDGTATATLRTPSAGDGALDGEPVPTGSVAFVGVVGEFRGTYQLVPVEVTDLQQLVACAVGSPLSFDFDGDGNGRGSDVMADDFNSVGTDPAFGEFVGVRNESASGPGGQAIDLASCSFVVFDPFSETVTYAAPLTGTASVGDAYVLATQNGDQAFGRADVLTDNPGAFALVEGVATEGAALETVLGRIVAAVVYDGARDVFGSIGGGSTPSDRVSFAQALAALGGGATATDDEVPAELAVTVAPNPVAGTGRVWLTLPTAADVRVAVYDALGREVAVLADGRYGQGRHGVDWSASRLPAGVYVVRVVASGEARTTRVTVVR